jgi:hypothetical protein
MATDPPYSGTIHLDGKIITTADPTAFLSVTDAGQAERSMFDRRLDAYKTFNAYLFNAKFDDGLAAEIRVNPEFGSSDAARIQAQKYAAVIGKLPKAVRTQVKTVSIHQGVQLFGGGENLVIHTGQADQYERDGILEEALLHEACHTLDAAHSSATWIAARTADKGTFISTYARDNPQREDVAESFLCWLAVRDRRARISKADADKILETIPNRIAYFDAQALDMHPIARSLWGTWTYRCFNPRFVTQNQTPQEDTLILAEAVLTLRTTPDPTGLVGTIEWPGRSFGVIDVLDVNGTWEEHSSSGFKRSHFHIRGVGRPGTETDGWEYEYHGRLVPLWPRGSPTLEHRPTLVGSVIRVKPHASSDGGTSPAGEVFSFIAMKPRARGHLGDDPRVLDWGLTGSWSYRSFHNNPTPVYKTAPPTGRLFERTLAEPNVYHGLILQEAVFKLETFEYVDARDGITRSPMMRGTIEWTGGVLTLEGQVWPAEKPLEFGFRAFGRPGTETDGWDFAYDGCLTWHWPKGVAQRPALVGSVNVFDPHATRDPYASYVGYVYPFIAVKQD